MLTFRFTGMVTVEETIGTRSIIDVIMKTDNAALEEVVVMAYDTDQSKKLSGAVAGVQYKGYPGTLRENYYRSIPDNRYNNNFNTEGYTAINENGYKSVKNSPLSTFSIDVDRASYSNVRRFINQGTKPPLDAVRIEEMVNYFKYDYPEPDREHPFSVYAEASTCPWNREHYLLHIGLKGKSIDKEG
ncbi:MAG: hypothetical protein E4G95_01290, partial [Bacteroidia bacterium]